MLRCLVSGSVTSSFQVREARVSCFIFIFSVLGFVLHFLWLCSVHDGMSMHWLLFWMYIWFCRLGILSENCYSCPSELVSLRRE